MGVRLPVTRGLCILGALFLLVVLLEDMLIIEEYMKDCWSKRLSKKVECGCELRIAGVRVVSWTAERRRYIVPRERVMAWQSRALY
jgi:hypothetical protein